MVSLTTLASSRWKSLDQINEAGQWACDTLAGMRESMQAHVGDDASDGDRQVANTIPPEDRQVIWWDQNWRKGGLQERRLQIIKEYDFYNQLYCGCEFSMRAQESQAEGEL